MREKIYISASIGGDSPELKEFNVERLKRIYIRLVRAGYNPSHAPVVFGDVSTKSYREISRQEIASSGRLFAVPQADGFIDASIWEDAIFARKNNVPVTWFRNEEDLYRWLRVKILTFAGPSGSGKTTIARELLGRKPESFKILTSITTRDPGPSDLPGEYKHVSKEEILAMARRNEFLWLTDPVKTHGNYYGTTKQSIDDALSAPHTSIMLLVPEVLEMLHEYTRNRVWSFYILSPPEEVLRSRLEQRGREDEQKINKRINDCKKWDADARERPNIYTFIRNDGPISEVVRDVLLYT